VILVEHKVTSPAELFGPWAFFQHVVNLLDS